MKTWEKVWFFRAVKQGGRSWAMEHMRYEGAKS